MGRYAFTTVLISPTRCQRAVLRAMVVDFRGVSGFPFHSPFLSFMAGELVGWLVSLLFWFSYYFALQRNTGAIQIEVIGYGTGKFHRHLSFFGYFFGGYSAIAMYFPRCDCFLLYDARCWGWKVLFGIYLFSCLYINGLLWGSKGEFFFLFLLSIMYER